MNPFNFLKNYFNFNKRERNGILILLTLLVLIVLARIVVRSIPDKIDVKITYLDSLAERIPTSGLQQTESSLRSYPGKISTEKNDVQLFVFDPNSASEEQLQDLGFSKKLSKTLINFRNKGGKFRKPEDLKKLYGMSDKLYAALVPYLLFPDQQNKTHFTLAMDQHSEKKSNALIELNSADSLQLLGLNGIGPSFARKILKFRNALGGFYSKEQLKEVYGMKDTLYLLFSDRLKVEAALIKKLNPNVCSYEEMKHHPYINHNIAASIVNYRGKHGTYRSTEDLKKVGTIPDEVLNRLSHYLEF